MVARFKNILFSAKEQSRKGKDYDQNDKYHCRSGSDSSLSDSDGSQSDIYHCWRSIYGIRSSFS
jgi:hypothetical protein